MNERLQELRKRLLLHKDILIVVSNNANNDSLLAASALFCTLNQIASDGPVFNTVDCLVLGNLSEMQEELIGKTTVQRFIHELQPKHYVVKIPKDGRISKVKWKEENEYFNLFLTPSFGELSIDNILFEQTGLNYKFIILIGFDDMSKLGEIYSNNEKYFENIPKAIIGGKNNFSKENIISIAESVPVSEIVYDFLKNLKVNLSKDTAQFLMNGFVESLDGFITNIQGKSTLNKMAELIDLGAEIISLDTAIGHKSSYTQLQLKQGIYANIKQDSSGILWSVIDNSELKSLQIEDEEINVSDKIPFNSYKGYGTAFILYEFSDGTVWGKIETEDLDLPKLLNGYESQVCHDGLVIKTD
ncbi:MAG: hypothetical protein GX660_20930, partial [Clostridiaceae bacterium]|nr:hypothetical protein [Clostridiaceae bacterium]